MNLNKAFVLGRLTADPEVRNLPSGQNVANFSIATNRIWNDKDGNRQDQTEFHNIVMFGKLADIASQYLAKGALCLIEGRIQTRSWEGQDGQKKYRTEIVAEGLQMGPRAANSGEGGGYAANSSKPAPKKKQEDTSLDELDENEVDVEDIPF